MPISIKLLSDNRIKSIIIKNKHSKEPHKTEVVMSKINNDLVPAQGIKYRLRVAFSLMSVLPLLVAGYLVSTYILPRVGLSIDIIVSIIVSVFIALIGFFLIKQIFDRVQSISSEAKLIAAGDIARRIDISSQDEVGYLGDALNQLTNRIRSNMDELEGYSERTAEINIGIQKRVLVLSSLLQISSLVSQSVRLEEVFKIVAEKSRLLANSDISYILLRQEGSEDFLMKAVEGAGAKGLSSLKIDSADKVFGRLIKFNKPLTIDKESAIPKDVSEAFLERFGAKNTLAVSVYLKGKVVVILGIANNNDSFIYQKDDVELLDIFAKQMAIAIENDTLMHRVEQLEIKDALTGLYNRVFIYNRLQEEISRAIKYQRPCAFTLLDIDNFQKFHQDFGSLQAESTLKKIALLIKGSVTDIDRVARTGDNEFAILLPEKNKRKAQEIAEDIRKKIEFTFAEETDAAKKLTVSIGVSENPLDGIEAQELINKAKEFLEIAKKQGKNRVIGTNIRPA
jgi:diguanylate cyclase (GGDEF)-like protein